MGQHLPSRDQPTRRRILDVACSLFLKQGYHGTSMRQIADHAQLAVSGIYNHFPSKETLFETVLLEHHPIQEILPMLQQDPKVDLPTFIQMVADRLLRAFQRRPQFLTLMVIEAVEFQMRHIGELYSSLLPGALQTFEQIVARTPNLRPIPTIMLIRTLAGLFVSYFITDIIQIPKILPDYRQDAMTHFIDIYLRGILRGD
jgi:AcrR family transcriptional regulator